MVLVPSALAMARGNKIGVWSGQRRRTDSTQASRAVERATATVTDLWTDVVLDDAAIEAQRPALLAELTAERFNMAYVRAGQRGDPTELAAARHLERGARLAREAAELDRSRCAAAYGANRKRVLT